MLDEKQLAAALYRALPAEQHNQVPRLARLLAAASSDGDPTVPSASEPLPHEIFTALAGQPIQSGGSSISFGSDNQIGNVSIRDAVGRDVVTLHVPITLPPQERSQRIKEERKLSLFGLTIFHSVTIRTIELLTIGILLSAMGLTGLFSVRFMGAGGVPTAIPISTEPPLTTATTRPSPSVTTTPPEAATATPTMLMPTRTPPPATATPFPDHPSPSPVPALPRLRARLLSYSDDPSCISFQVTGISTKGWRLTADGLELAADFDEAGNARLCGLANGQEITISIRDSEGKVIRGGAGIPAKGGSIFAAAWR